jgi:DNA-binding response OmpR family regulator
VNALVAAVDARLRVSAFDHLAALGYRVDAVGDAVAVGRRLAKDQYDLIVTDELEIPPVPEGTRVVRVTTAIIDDAGGWERALGE